MSQDAALEALERPAAERIAVRAGLAIGDALVHLKTSAGETLAARIGIATGSVVVGELIGDGAAQEQAVVGETPNLAARLQSLAEPGSVVIGAATTLTYGTTYHALVDRAQLKPKETLLVLGAAGGVGLAAVQLGNATGAALLGVLLFTPLANAAPDAYDGHDKQLRSELTAAGLPAAEARELSAQLRPCFLDYAKEENPDKRPASCGPVFAKAGSDPKVQQAVDKAVDAGRADIFTDTFGRFVWFTISGLVVVALLAQTMPREVRGYESRGGEGESEEKDREGAKS